MQCFFGALNELISLTLKTGAAFALLRFKRQLFFSGEDTGYNVIIAVISAKERENAENPIFLGGSEVLEKQQPKKSQCIFFGFVV